MARYKCFKNKNINRACRVCKKQRYKSRRTNEEDNKKVSLKVLLLEGFLKGLGIAILEILKEGNNHRVFMNIVRNQAKRMQKIRKEYLKNNSKNNS